MEITKELFGTIRFNTEFYSFEDKNKEDKLFSSENTNEGE